MRKVTSCNKERVYTYEFKRKKIVKNFQNDYSKTQL